jgi:steroid delta-isomerase-like uncharacterized protein
MADNKAIAQRIIDELWNGRRPELIDELYAADCVIRNPDGDLRGPEGYRELYGRYTGAFPDAKLHLDGEIVVDGSTVAIPYTFTGTHQGELQGIAPTGRKVSVKGTTISRIVDGKLQEERAIWDTGSLLQQLGVIPQ